MVVICTVDIACRSVDVGICEYLVVHRASQTLSLMELAFSLLQALIDLHEADGDFEKFLEACNNVRQITQASGDLEMLASCTERLASALVKAGRHDEALDAWQQLLKDANVATTDVHLKALCGVVDAQAALLEMAIQHEKEKSTAGRIGKFDVKSLRVDLENNIRLALQQPGSHVERHNALLLDLLLQTAGESRGL